MFGSEKWATLSSDLKLCDALNGTVQDSWIVQSNLMGNFQGIAQYNNEKA